LDGLVESVLVVVVDAAPSSRLKAMIQVIIGASLLLGTAVSPHRREAWAQKTFAGECEAHSVLVGRYAEGLTQ
jgi:hypothetical protein